MTFSQRKLEHFINIIVSLISCLWKMVQVVWIEGYEPGSQTDLFSIYLQIVWVMSKWDNGHLVCACTVSTQHVILSPSFSVSPDPPAISPQSSLPPPAPATFFPSLLSFYCSAIWDKFVGGFVLCCVVDPKAFWSPLREVVKVLSLFHCPAWAIESNSYLQSSFQRVG